ncbi:MAG: TonB-dependent receptor [Alphaproteobacteria bacterium]|nr:TonB-dependent receptor [Alphaproteobacteria bacterium]
MSQMLVANLAVAQVGDSQQLDKAASINNTVVTDIVVTAQRQSQSLQRVPIAVTSISASTLEDLNIRSIDKIAIVTPSLVFDTGYNIAQIYIRGIGAQNVFGIGLESPVATYIDGAYFARGVGAVFDAVDVSSVEVLKGPQGTLYGRNASGGAILINTANPTREPGASASFEYGNFGHVLADGMVNLPASDSLSFRVAGRYRNDDGFITNITSGRKVRGKTSEEIRGKVKWDPTAEFTAVLSADYRHETIEAAASGRQDALAPFCLGCVFGGASEAGFYQVTEDYVRQDGFRGHSFNLNLQYDLGPVKITGITAYRYASGTISDDQEHTSVPLVGTYVTYGGKTFSEDIQIASSLDGAFDFLIGAQYIRDNAFEDVAVFGALLGLPYVNGAGIPDGAINAMQTVITKSYAAFAELYIRPIEHLTLTMGGRYSKDDRHISSDLNPLGVAVFNPGGPEQFSQSASYKKFTPRAVIAYDAGIVNVYGSFTRGFKAGGFAAPSFGPQDIPIRPETIDSYELGVKFVSPDRATRINLAGFYYDYSDVQVSLVDTAHNSQIIVNAASARGKGVEFDLSHKLVEWLTLGAGGSYLDTKYTDYQNAAVFDPVRDAGGNVIGAVVGTMDLTGTPLPRAPKWSGYISASVKAPIGNGWTGKLNALAHFSSSYLFNPGAAGELRTDRQKSTTIVGGSASIGPDTGEYQISLYVDNLTKEKYYTNRIIGGFGINSLVAAPRTYGVRLSAEF